MKGGPPAKRQPDQPKRTDQAAMSVQSPSGNRIELSASRTFVGPLPHPADLAAYASISPDLVNRIVVMAEAEGDHRRSLERRLVTAAIWRGYIGQVFGLAVGLGGLATAAFLGYHNHPAVAAIVAGIDIVGLVGVFVLGRRQDKPPEQPSEQLQLPLDDH